MTLFQKYKELKKTPQVPAVQTSFGKHSKAPIVPVAVETSFGTHSLEKKQVHEATEPVADSAQSPYSKYFRKKSEHAKIHDEIAPMHEDKASGEDLAAVVDYTDDSYQVNKALYHSHTKNKPVPKELHPTIKALTSFVLRHKTTSDTHVFTGTKFSPAQHFTPDEDGNIPEHAHFDLPAFTSTTTAVRTAKPFADDVKHGNDSNHGVEYGTDWPVIGKAKHILKIDLPKGTSAMSTREHSMMPSENEILLNRGHTIEVHKTPERLDEHTYLWHAKVIGHNPKPIL